MRTHLAILALTLASATSLAHADTYQFSFSGMEGPCSDPSCFTYTAQWQLTSTPDSFTSTTATYNNLAVQDNIGQSSSPYIAILQTSGAATDGQEIDFDDSTYGSLDLIFNVFLPTTTFFNGPTSSPTFLVGSYAASLYSVGLSDSIYGDATITDLSAPPTTVTPEPSTLALLGTGVFGVAGLLRRRLTR